MNILARLKPQSLISAYLPLILWAVMIFSFSAQPSMPGPEAYWTDFLFKKFAHIFVYAVLYVLSLRALSLHTAFSLSKHWYLPVLMCFFYALTDEFHQSLIPNRFASFRDVGYDMFGVLVVFLKVYRYV